MWLHVWITHLWLVIVVGIIFVFFVWRLVSHPHQIETQVAGEVVTLRVRLSKSL